MTETPTADKGLILCPRRFTWPDGSQGGQDWAIGEATAVPAAKPSVQLGESRAEKLEGEQRAEQCCMGLLHRRAEGNLLLPAKDKPLRITSRMPTRK